MKEEKAVDSSESDQKREDYKEEKGPNDEDKEGQEDKESKKD